jgi:hypothetical protein
LAAAGCGGASSDGYNVTAPAGWKDQTGLTKRRSDAKVEALWRGPGATIAIVRARAPAGSSLDDVMRAGQDTMRSESPGTQIGAITAARLGGGPAASFDYSRPGVQARQLGAVHGDHVYLITFSAKPAVFEQRRQTLDALLRSWRWTR